MKNRKINNLGVFIILLLSLLLATLANTYEGFENEKTKYARQEQNKAKSMEGNKYDPFINDNKQKKSNQGIRKSDIMPGTEDMYILKSEIVPPVCPKCPENNSCPRQKPCPPCKPCGRCPEQPFECKKVPNYNVANVSNELPLPLLNSFAEFA